MKDTLKVNVNEETSEIQLDWDPEDPNWSFLNGLTDAEIKIMIEKSIRNKLEELSDDA